MVDGGREKISACSIATCAGKLLVILVSQYIASLSKKTL